tara:strand:- start:13925 stop:14140 length:216 start_codon:yes stop_codon:yes gene_type:complete
LHFELHDYFFVVQFVHVTQLLLLEEHEHSYVWLQHDLQQPAFDVMHLQTSDEQPQHWQLFLPQYADYRKVF